MSDACFRPSMLRPTRPILFSGPTVRAILEGRKTQTRRVAKVHVPYVIDERDDGRFWPFDTTWADGDESSPWMPGPYGDPGDLLWVRETHAIVPMRTSPWPDLPHAVSPDGDFVAHYREGFDRVAPRWRPSIHMPRWASRRTLRVEDVRLEKLQDISESDAVAEGIVDDGEGGWFVDQDSMGTYRQTGGSLGGPRYNAPRYAFRALWDSINKKRDYGWDTNPWVWAVTFSAAKEFDQ